MATLSDILAAFLDDADQSEGTALRKLVIKLAADSVGLVADYSCGEVPALVQRCGTAMAWLNAEAKDPDSATNRRGRMRAMLDLLDVAESIRTFHAGKGDDDHLAAMRNEVADALRPIVVAADD